MSEQITIKFTGKPWKITPGQAAHDIAGADYVFDSPDFKGKGSGSYVVTHLAGKDGAPQKSGEGDYAFDGQILFEGTIKGKQGAIMIRERGVTKDGQYQSEWVWFPESGSGELQGTAGEAQFKFPKGQQAKGVEAKGDVSFP